MGEPSRGCIVCLWSRAEGYRAVWNCSFGRLDSNIPTFTEVTPWIPMYSWTLSLTPAWSTELETDLLPLYHEQITCFSKAHILFLCLLEEPATGQWSGIHILSITEPKNQGNWRGIWHRDEVRKAVHGSLRRWFPTTGTTVSSWCMGIFTQLKDPGQLA